MKYRISIVLISLLFIFSSLQNSVIGNENDLDAQSLSPEQQISNYIEKYGKTTLIDIILDIRAASITVSDNGKLVEKMGRPNKNHITTETILHDIKLANLDIDEFSQRLEQYLNRKNLKQNNSEQSKNTELEMKQYSNTDKIGINYREYSQLENKCKLTCREEKTNCEKDKSKHWEKCLQSLASSKQCNDIYYGSMQKCKIDRTACEDQCKIYMKQHYVIDNNNNYFY